MDRLRLKTISLHNAITNIGDNAFWFCCEKSPLKELTISKNVKTIEEEAFAYTKLDKLILPKLKVAPVPPVKLIPLNTVDTPACL